jgi:energy-coupling factor transporter transmembrane protein EcfT
MAIEFRRGTSELHRLDARTKLLLFAGLTVTVVIILDPVVIALLFFLLYGFGRRAIDPKLLNNNLRVLVVIFATFAAFQVIFFTPADAYLLFHLVPGPDWIPVTAEGLVRAVAVFFRFFIVVLAVHLMLYTTPPVDLVLAVTNHERHRPLGRRLVTIGVLSAVIAAILLLGFTDLASRWTFGPVPGVLTVLAASVVLAAALTVLVGHGLPAEMGMALSIGFATVGLVSQQTQKITDAQRARGYDVRPRSLVKRVQVLTALLLPIFLATLERSQDIAVAILARGFDYDIRNRTYRRQLQFRRADHVVLTGIVALIVGGLLVNRLGYGDLTESVVRGMLED